MNGTDPVYGTESVALRVRISRNHFVYLIAKGKLPGPSLQVPGRRLFTEEDVQKILRRLEEEPECGRLPVSPPGDVVRGGPGKPKRRGGPGVRHDSIPGEVR